MTYYERTYIALPSVMPKPLKKLFSEPWGSDPGTLAIQMVKTQVSRHETRKLRAVTNDTEGRIPSLSDAAMEKLAVSIGEDVEGYMKAMEVLPPNVLSRVALRLENTPYDVFCKMRRATLPDEDTENTDEWVLRNEVWLRDVAESAKSAHHPSKKFHGASGAHVQGFDKLHWAYGMVRLSTHAGIVFPGSVLTDTCRTIARPESLPGFKILDGRRPPVIRIQPSVEMFGKTFDAMTSGILKGLDWGNIFIAGGIVLGALLCTADSEATSTPKQWESSDIDLYIYGVGPVEANEKMEHVFSVFTSNLAKDASALVVRNAKTITFFSEYPTRRVQVVLKLVDSPKDVLLNFDLDACAVGWDNEEVWMLPRAARALETGYTVFTMDLINGHYLGDRRATQEQRVFKYADRGFGIRILPTYIKEYEALVSDPDEAQAGEIDASWWRRSWHFDALVAKARRWTNKFIQKQKRDEGLDSAPTTSHYWLQERTQISADPPRRSSLSGLSLFMRHVALWEQELAGAVIVDKDDWAMPKYDKSLGGVYDDAPDYQWNEQFTNDGLMGILSAFNLQCFTFRFECTEAIDALFADGGTPAQARPAARRETCHSHGWDFQVGAPEPSDNAQCRLVQRITHARSVREILRPKCDLLLPVWLPRTFLDYADDVVPACVRTSAALPGYTTKPFIRIVRVDEDNDDSDEASVHSDQKNDAGDWQLVVWRITSVTMWQQLSRTIDEVHEALWSFYITNSDHPHIEGGLGEARLRLLLREFGRRAVRVTAQDEYAAFVSWVERKPVPFSEHYWGDDPFEDSEDEF